VSEEEDTCTHVCVQQQQQQQQLTCNMTLEMRQEIVCVSSRHSL
jgi:hypothetical protein